GMPCRTTPFVKIQKSAPGVACCTSSARRFAPFFPPSACIPWHSAQCCSKSFLPAPTASGSFSSGLRLARAFSGTFARAAYSDLSVLRTQEFSLCANAEEATRAKRPGVKSPKTAARHDVLLFNGGLVTNDSPYPQNLRTPATRPIAIVTGDCDRSIRTPV